MGWHIFASYPLFPSLNPKDEWWKPDFISWREHIKCSDLVGVVIAACYPKGTANCKVQIQFSVKEECRIWPIYF